MIAGRVGLATSASTSSTVLSSSIAMLMARLIEVNVLPSPGRALVTMIMFARATERRRLPQRVVEQRALDDAELVRDLRTGRVRGDHARRGKPGDIDHHPLGSAALGGRRGGILGGGRRLRRRVGGPVDLCVRFAADLVRALRRLHGGEIVVGRPPFRRGHGAVGDLDARVPQLLEALGRLLDETHPAP